MASYDDIVNFRVDASQLSAGLGKAQADYKALRDTVDQINDQAKQGIITDQQRMASILGLGHVFKKTYADIRAELAALNGAANQANAAAQNVAASAAKATAASGGAKGKASADGLFGGKGAYYFSTIAQAAQDAQYGIKNVENNILAVTASMGGLGVAVGIVSVVGIELYQHWDQVAKLWGGGATKTEAERMEELAKAVHHTAAEKKALRDFELKEATTKAGDAPSKETTEAAGKIAEIYKNADGVSTVANKVLEALSPGGLSAEGLLSRANPEEQKRLAKANAVEKGRLGLFGEIVDGPATSAADPAKANEMRAQLAKDIKARLTGEMAGFLSDARDPAAIGNIADLLDEAGQEDLASQVRDLIKPGFVGPMKPENFDRDQMREEMRRFNQEGDSDIIAGPGRAQWNDQKATQDVAAARWEEERKRFNETGESTIIAGPGQFLAGEQKQFDDEMEEGWDAFFADRDKGADLDEDSRKEAEKRAKYSLDNLSASQQLQIAKAAFGGASAGQLSRGIFGMLNEQIDDNDPIAAKLRVAASDAASSRGQEIFGDMAHLAERRMLQAEMGIDREYKGSEKMMGIDVIDKLNAAGISSDNIPKGQLDQLKEVNKNLKDLTDKLDFQVGG